MAKSAEAFRSIGEVAAMIGVAPHVLRYWETQFTALKPMKRPDGRRYYRPADIDLAAGICALLRDDGLTVKGARKLIVADRGEAVRQRGAAHLSPMQRADPPLPMPLFPDISAPGHAAAGPSAPVGRHHSSPSAVPVGWLVRLTTLSQDLHRAGPDHPHWPDIHRSALALAQAMLRLS